MEKNELLETALKRFKEAEEYYQEDYDRNQADVEFVMGQQWPEDIKAQRHSEGRPCLTENRMLPFVHQVVNQIRQARPKIRPRPVDSDADIEVADILKGMIRNIEMTSDGESVYDTAAYNSVTAGYGWIRVNTKYADENSFDQELCVERVLNPFSVYIDPNASRMDAADADWVFIFDDMDKDAFSDTYPDASTDGFEVSDKNRSWLSDDKIRIAEYYYRHYETKTLVQYRS